MIGLDLLGLSHTLWPIKQTIRALPTESIIGCFDETFGDVIPNLRKLLSSNKITAVRVHLWWSDAHKIAPDSVIKERAPKYEKLANQYPWVSFFLSHSCEYNEKNAKVIAHKVELLKKHAPSCEPINAVWKGPTPPGAYIERHGDITVKAGQFISTDGINAFDIDINSWLNRNEDAHIRFLWGQRFNLREATKPGQKPPPPKLRKAAPSIEYIKGVMALGSGFGAPPSEPAGAVLKKPHLWKPFAEDSQGQDDKRENRPVLLLKTGAKKIEILAKNGKHLGKLVIGGTFAGGLTRFYSGLPGGIGLYGYQIAEKAAEVSSSPWVWLDDGKRLWGPVHPAFRFGYFR